MACSKHRGIVMNNVDPEQIGRLQVVVPGLMETPAFALPCVPYAGPDVGFVAIPPVGAKVWVEFENDNPDFPIWTGCFWGPEDVPSEIGAPEQKVFKTEGVTLIMDDTPGQGGLTLTVNPPLAEAPLTLSVTFRGIALDNGLGAKILISGSAVSIETDTGAQISLVGAAVTIDSGDQAKVVVDGTSVVLDSSVGSQATLSPALVSVQAGAARVTASLVDVDGNANVSGLTNMNGGATIFGIPVNPASVT